MMNVCFFSCESSEIELGDEKNVRQRPATTINSLVAGPAGRRSQSP
jgi:hypothetical protein